MNNDQSFHLTIDSSTLKGYSLEDMQNLTNFQVIGKEEVFNGVFGYIGKEGFPQGELVPVMTSSFICLILEGKLPSRFNFKAVMACNGKKVTGKINLLDLNLTMGEDKTFRAFFDSTMSINNCTEGTSCHV